MLGVRLYAALSPRSRHMLGWRYVLNASFQSVVTTMAFDSVRMETFDPLSLRIESKSNII